MYIYKYVNKKIWEDTRKLFPATTSRWTKVEEETWSRASGLEPQCLIYECTSIRLNLSIF